MRLPSARRGVAALLPYRPRRGRNERGLPKLGAARAIAEDARGLHHHAVVAQATQPVGTGESVAQNDVARKVHAELGVKDHLGRAAGFASQIEKGEPHGLSPVTQGEG